MAKTNKKKEIQLGFRISKIHTIKFGYTDISNEKLNDLFSLPNALGVNINVAVNINKIESAITMDVSSNLLDSENNSVLIEHVGRTTY